ncbi:MAG: hypothetical protein WBQ94_12180 [Terracidiphilus sp.]
MIEQGKIKEASFFRKCVACGAKYRPKFFVKGTKVIPASDHVCNKKTLRRRELMLQREFDDEPIGYECGDIDCAFEIVEAMKGEME